MQMIIEVGDKVKTHRGWGTVENFRQMTKGGLLAACVTLKDGSIDLCLDSHIIEVEKNKATEKEPSKELQKRPHTDLCILYALGHEIQHYDKYLGTWEDCCTEPYWLTDKQYRVKPSEPEPTKERVFPESSLSDEVLHSLYSQIKYSSYCDIMRASANIAVKQYILDMEKANDK